MKKALPATRELDPAGSAFAALAYCSARTPDTTESPAEPLHPAGPPVSAIDACSAYTGSRRKPRVLPFLLGQGTVGGFSLIPRVIVYLVERVHLSASRFIATKPIYLGAVAPLFLLCFLLLVLLCDFSLLILVPAGGIEPTA